MSKIGTWSTTAGNNNATPPDGWPEGQAPSTVNDCAREMMAQIRTTVNDLQYIDLGNTPSFLTATTFSMGAADATNFVVGRRVKLFDATTLYGTIISTSATFVQVRLDGGALTASLSSMAMAVITPTNNSLPTVAYRNKNFIINGNMDIWQRNTQFLSMANNQFMADRWKFETIGTASIHANRLERSANASNVPTLAQAGVYLNNCLVLSVAAVDAAVAATDFGFISQYMEGFNFREIAHKPTNVTFWVSTNISGVYSCALRGVSSSASCVQAFTISAINTWTKVFLTFPEAPTGLTTWNYSDSVGVVLSIALQGGTNFQVTNAGAWTAMNAIAVPGQVNLFGTFGGVFKLTGVQVKEGLADTPPEQRDYATELALCQRYYWRGLPCRDLNAAAYTASCTLSWPVTFATTMRIAPTMSFVGITPTYSICQSATVGSITQHGYRFLMFSTAADPNCNINFGVLDYIEASAEM